MWKVPSLYQEIEKHPYHQRPGLQGQEACVNKSCYFFTNLLPQVQTFLSCQLFTNLLFFCLKHIKIFLLLSLIWVSCSMSSHTYKLNFSPVNPSCVKLIIRPARRMKRGRGNISPPWQVENRRKRWKLEHCRGVCSNCPGKMWHVPTISKWLSFGLGPSWDVCAHVWVQQREHWE